ncbi:MAG TPA: 2-dehydropantoate 2-reductase [Candidatus Dormibacteraeota bacterium]|nr:2-dehydropantoate 2-reductase [Candidatus Dormibacteraeota bacterium]
MTDRLRVAVLGPGGVGGLMAALLARSGDSVLVLAGDSTAQEIESRGIQVESRRFGDFTATPRAATHLSEPVDAVLVAVKATHLEEAAKRVPPAALGDAIVVPFLNGLDHVDVLRRIYGVDRVVPATMRIESARIGPGVIRHTSALAGIEIGSKGAAVAERLRAAGFDVKIRDDEKPMLWEKFVFLAPMALLTTEARANVGVIRADRRADLVALFHEVSDVARAEGVAIDPASVLRFFDAIPPSMETSMQRDQATGRPLEIDALGHSVLRRAAKAGVKVPVTTRLVERIESRSASRSA